MYATILWATDGSPEADGALHEALGLLKPGGTLVRSTATSGLPADASAVPPSRSTSQIGRSTSRRRSATYGATAECQLHRRVDAPRSVARDPAVASDLDVDVIVCGTTSPHGLNALLNGSVAAGILKRATVPVIVVPAKAPVAHPDAVAV